MTARLDTLVPRKNLWVELAAVASRVDGFSARGEAGVKLNDILAAYVAATLSSNDVRGEAGVRLTF